MNRKSEYTEYVEMIPRHIMHVQNHLPLDLTPSLFLLSVNSTNHLDAESIAWLETYLDKFQGTVVCITHDRYFLNNCAGWILELDRGKGYPHEGNYETFLEMKNKRLEEEKKAETAAAKAVSNELEWIRTNPKAKGNKSKARLNRYEELLSAAAPKELRNAGQIYIPPGPRLGNEVVEVVNLKKSFGDRLLIDDLSFSLPPAGIVGVVGPNGAGKSTLIKMLTGKEEPDSGSIKIGETVSFCTKILTFFHFQSHTDTLYQMSSIHSGENGVSWTGTNGRT